MNSAGPVTGPAPSMTSGMDAATNAAASEHYSEWVGLAL
jgi:hypothetical protein